ncbi:type II and III secretion system protein [Pseudomonas frederiksbergensis]|uniref:type II and III secretion system protein n=1 Tax=Pseudomonas frederiksbergensis TaxID=104087 RepID=UPI0013747BE4|nr:type II and III secretion system protein [Pseudomonas frederiksbergensis]
MRSGKEATINVGAEVPVLGALSYPQGAGQAVQSVEYRNSGVIFTITPQVRQAVVDLTIDQLSNFVQTTTGVNGSPTLTKRQLTTNVQMRNAEVVILGGLTEEKPQKRKLAYLSCRLFSVPRLLSRANRKSCWLSR